VAIVTLTTDFTGKILGSLTENPHIARHTAGGGTGKYTPSGNLLLPWQMGEIQYQQTYTTLAINDNSPALSSSSSSNLANDRGQIAISYDVIWAIEQRYGQTLWQGKSSLEDKIRIAKEIVQEVTATFYGYGFSYYGDFLYKRYMSVLSDDNVWSPPIKATNDTYVGLDYTTDLDGYIDGDGYVHFNIYTDIDTTPTQSNEMVNLTYTNIDITLDDSIKLTAPTGLTAASDVMQINLSWNTDPNATSYNVLRSTSSGQGYKPIGSTVNPTFKDVMDMELDTTTYYYVVTAVNEQGESDYSIEVAAKPIPKYTEVNVFIHPSRWSGGALPMDVREELVAKYSVQDKNQTIHTQAPMISIKTYN
jgi:hypothetical protein